MRTRFSASLLLRHAVLARSSKATYDPGESVWEDLALRRVTVAIDLPLEGGEPIERARCAAAR